MMADNARAWLRARGFWIIIIAALVPPLLTAAWVGTHQDDVRAADIRWDATEIEGGDVVDFTVVVENGRGATADAFNVTARIGFYEQTQTTSGLSFRAQTTEDFRVEGLGANERREVAFNWTTRPGTWLVELRVDTDDELAEIEELNNVRQAQLFVRFAPVQLDVQIPEPAPGSGLLSADLAIVALHLPADDVYEDETANVTIEVTNHGPSDVRDVTLRFRVHAATLGGYSPTPLVQEAETVNLTAGATIEVPFSWTPRSINQYALVAIIDPSGVSHEINGSNNAVLQEIFVDRRLVFDEPDPQATAKAFYIDTLSFLHLTLLIPLIALFYGAGVIEDEREKGNLPYLLTRPIPRWTVPVARFVVSFFVAGVAIALGVIASYLLLLRLPQAAAAGFLWWPLAFSLLALAVYGALWTFVGVWSHRPYLVGLLYALGLEAAIVLGRSVAVNGRPLLQDWVLWFSLRHWTNEVFASWDPEAAFTWLPAGDGVARALLVLVGVAVVSLVGAAMWMRRREFA
jgi:hypothetical protein